MNTKTIVYLSLLALALVSLAVGGWVAKGVRALVDRTREAALRPRLV